MIGFSDKLRFEILCREEMLAKKEDPYGIGTLQEKRLHSIIKKYICPDMSAHEIPVSEFTNQKEGRIPKYVADILLNDCIYEVQTGAFYPMKDKIKYYLENTDYNIIIVHPVAELKWVSWIDPDTSEVGKKNKSPKKGKATDIADDLYTLLPYIDNPRISVWIMLLEIEEYRWKNGWGNNGKRGSQRYQQIPVNLFDIVKFELPEDYEIFIPENLNSEFTVPEYAELSKIKGRAAYSAVKVLCRLNLVQQIEKKGRAQLYKRIV